MSENNNSFDKLIMDSALFHEKLFFAFEHVTDMLKRLMFEFPIVIIFSGMSTYCRYAWCVDRNVYNVVFLGVLYNLLNLLPSSVHVFKVTVVLNMAGRHGRYDW